MRWVGLAGLSSYTPEEQRQLSKALRKLNAYPVFVDPETLAQFTAYYVQVITPLLHNVFSCKRSPNVGSAALLEAYRVVNKSFADVVLGVCKGEPKALVLYNDDYFFLAPKLVAEKVSLRTGYFMHSSFPNYETFQVFPACQEVSRV